MQLKKNNHPIGQVKYLLEILKYIILSQRKYHFLVLER